MEELDDLILLLSFMTKKVRRKETTQKDGLFEIIIWKNGILVISCLLPILRQQDGQFYLLHHLLSQQHIAKGLLVVPFLL